MSRRARAHKPLEGGLPSSKLDNDSDRGTSTANSPLDDASDGTYDRGDQSNERSRGPKSDTSDFAIDLALSWASYPAILRDPRLTRLIHHYDQHLVGTLVWVDSQHNPWRDTILPKAMENPVLMFSILALASAHILQGMSAVAAPSSSDTVLFLNLRGNSLSSLAQYLHDERSVDDSSVADVCKRDSDAILATMLILYHVELIRPDSNMTRLHLQAARILLRHLFADSSRNALSNTAYQFLRREVIVIDVSAFISDFHDMIEPPEGYLIEQEGTLFDLYVLVIRDITIAERRRHATMKKGEAVMPVNMEWWNSRLSQAHDRSRYVCHQLRLLSGDQADDLDRLTDVYYSAGLIYASQALSDALNTEKEIEEVSSRLIANLIQLCIRPCVVQDLAWPAFIAGTACYGKEDEQRKIEKVLEEFMSRTGFFHGQQAVNFLKAYWTSPREIYTNWIDFARSYSGMETISLPL